MSSTTYISQTTIDALMERVCLQTSYLSTKLDSATPLWDGPISMCQRIEADEMTVDSVIKEAKKRNDLFRGSTVYLYQALLCRVYILLYYRHRDDVLYKTFVFERITSNIGTYYKNCLTNINGQIDKLLEQEALVRKVRSERQQAAAQGDSVPAQTSAQDTAERKVLLKRMADVEVENRLLREQLQKADDENRQLRQQLQKADDEAVVPDVKDREDVLYNKVAFEFFLRLLEHAGLDLDDTGNKTEAGKLWHMVTGKSADDLRRYCSLRKYKNYKTKPEINVLDEQLSTMNINTIRLGDYLTQSPPRVDTNEIEQPQ